MCEWWAWCGVYVAQSCECLDVCTCAHTCEGQRKTLGVFFYRSQLYCLETGSLVEPEAPGFAMLGWLTNELLGYPHLCLPTLGLQAQQLQVASFYMSSGKAELSRGVKMIGPRAALSLIGITEKWRCQTDALEWPRTTGCPSEQPPLRGEQQKIFGDRHKTMFQSDESDKHGLGGRKRRGDTGRAHVWLPYETPEPQLKFKDN